jgi:hypothetical protein
VGYVPGNPRLRHTVQVLPVRLMGARSLTALSTKLYRTKYKAVSRERDVYTPQ